VLETGAVSYGRGTSYSPVVDLLKQYFGIEGRDDHPRVREKVAEKLMALDPALARYHAALLWLLDVRATIRTGRTWIPPNAGGGRSMG